MKWKKINNFLLCQGKNFSYGISVKAEVPQMAIGSDRLRVSLNVKDVATAKKIAELLEK